MNYDLMGMTNFHLWSVNRDGLPAAHKHAVASGSIESARRSAAMVVRSGIGIIGIMGPIDRRPGILNELFGAVSSEAIRESVLEAASNPKIRSLLLRVDSPGGSVSGLAELSDAVAQAASIKPVIAQVEGMAASAAYHVASQATAIFAGRMDMVGSIGTKLTVMDTSKMFQDAGVTVHTFDTGPIKSAGEPGTELTKVQADHFQSLVDGFFEDFVSAVSRGRNMSREAVMGAATGEMFLADKALEMGLIDGIQTLDQTIGDLLSGSGEGRLRAARAKLALTNLN